MRPVGFSTGALGLGDTAKALEMLRGRDFPAIEFSALRWPELDQVLREILLAVPGSYQYVSCHAPSAFPAEREAELVELLAARIPRPVPIVVHPDTISRVELWRALGPRLLLENMDLRKRTGRRVEELRPFFDVLPEARFCLDVGHARQFDPSMTEAWRMLRAFQDRLVQAHVSEVATNSQHDRLSETAILAFREIADMVPESIPLIIESRVPAHEIDAEVARVRRAFPIHSPVLAVEKR